MALNDVTIRKNPTSGSPITLEWQTDAGDTTILPGEPVKFKAAGGEYVIPLADGDSTIGTDTQFVGVAASESTQTASADGTVSVYVPFEGVVYEMATLDPTAADTQAKVDALVGSRLVVDLTAGVYTIDTAAGDGANNLFLVVGGDAERSTLYVIARASGSFLN